MTNQTSELNSTDEARQYVIEYMRKHFNDKTFADYIRNDLAGDFAYQLASALRAPTQPDNAVPWENFPGYLIDHCEGQTISEEFIQQTLVQMLNDSNYSSPEKSIEDTDNAVSDEELTELRKDAERYRWLRDSNDVKGSTFAHTLAHNFYGVEWDGKIDAAINDSKGVA